MYVELQSTKLGREEEPNYMSKKGKAKLTEIAIRDFVSVTLPSWSIMPK